METIIDRRNRYSYSSYYLRGIVSLIGAAHVHSAVQPFLGLSYNNLLQYNSGLPLIVRDRGVEKNIFIDFEDQAKIEQDRYDWCDVYAKVNMAFGDEEKYPKMMPIGPSFGITLASYPTLVIKSIWNFLHIYKNTSMNAKTYLKDYLYTHYRRRPLEVYSALAKVRENYIFHASTLWYDPNTDGTTNFYRGEFLKAAKKVGLKIEGGLFYLDSPSVIEQFPKYAQYKEDYKDFIFKERLSMDDYLQKTKESVVVFNTPSVCSCHGWKLAEYLCMGKAIISTPLTREMPGEGLVHGENIHFVNSPEEIYDAVMKINTDEAYRRKLEKGAKAYYEQWLAPKIVVKRIIDRVLSLE